MFSGLIKILRTQRGVSQTRLAKEIGVSAGNIGDWEIGRSKPGLERVANEISARSETVKDVPLDLFHPSEAALEKGDAFYYEMLRAIGPTKDAWRDYKKYIRRYETYLHDIRAFNGTSNL